MDRAETLQQLAWLCRNGRTATASAVEASGWAQFDAVLPGGGWQAGTIVELLPAATGIGELSLLMPALAHITSAGRHVALVAPPYIPFAPALSRHGVQLERLLVIRTQQNADALWAAEQVLRCKSFGAVLVWPMAIKDRETRRLQLAAEAGCSIGFVYRPAEAALESSPAALRLKLRRCSNGELEIEIVKAVRGRSGRTVKIAAMSGCQWAVSEEAPHASLSAAGNSEPLKLQSEPLTQR